MAPPKKQMKKEEEELSGRKQFRGGPPLPPNDPLLQQARQAKKPEVSRRPFDKTRKAVVDDIVSGLLSGSSEGFKKGIETSIPQDLDAVPGFGDFEYSDEARIRQHRMNQYRKMVDDGISDRDIQQIDDPVLREQVKRYKQNIVKNFGEQLYDTFADIPDAYKALASGLKDVKEAIAVGDDKKAGELVGRGLGMLSGSVAGSFGNLAVNPKQIADNPLDAVTAAFPAAKAAKLPGKLGKLAGLGAKSSAPKVLGKAHLQKPVANQVAALADEARAMDRLRAPLKIPEKVRKDMPVRTVDERPFRGQLAEDAANYKAKTWEGNAKVNQALKEIGESRLTPEQIRNMAIEDVLTKVLGKNLSSKLTKDVVSTNRFLNRTEDVGTSKLPEAMSEAGRLKNDIRNLDINKMFKSEDRLKELDEVADLMTGKQMEDYRLMDKVRKAGDDFEELSLQKRKLENRLPKSASNLDKAKEQAIKAAIAETLEGRMQTVGSIMPDSMPKLQKAADKFLRKQELKQPKKSMSVPQSIAAATGMSMVKKSGESARIERQALFDAAIDAMNEAKTPEERLAIERKWAEADKQFED